ncbi:MAG TPA: hypothetical protein VMB91_11375, partial [Solirubrobacteraceae bacterium]|nr:hypothetical protein [Solirubrobacteraceae bacterium]
MPSRRIAPATMALAVAVTGALGGCGSTTDSLSSKSPQAIVLASEAAARRARSVHIRSNLSSGRETVSLDLQLARDGGRAKITLPDGSEEVLHVGSALYVKGTPAFDRAAARIGGVPVPTGSWVTVPAGGRTLGQFTALTTMDTEISLLLGTNRKDTRAGTSTAPDGTPLIAIKESG